MTEYTALAETIRRDFAAIGASLCAISPPNGHAWSSDDHELNWFGRDILLSTRHGASIFVRRSVNDLHDPTQLHIEIRLFWNDNGNPKPTPGTMRAIVWAHRGIQINFKSQSLLDSNAAFLHAGSCESLTADLLQLIQNAFARYAEANSPNEALVAA